MSGQTVTQVQLMVSSWVEVGGAGWEWTRADIMSETQMLVPRFRRRMFPLSSSALSTSTPSSLAYYRAQ